LFPEEEFLTRDDVALAQEKYKHETAVVALRQGDETAPTGEAFQQNIDRLLRLEIEVRTELAKLQSLSGDVPSPRTPVADTRGKMNIGEQNIVYEALDKKKQDKRKMTTRDFAADSFSVISRAIRARFYEAVIVSSGVGKLFHATSETVRVEKDFNESDFCQDVG
ncbi:unnamed protein product, partial [Ixodes hexagonus]